MKLKFAWSLLAAKFIIRALYKYVYFTAIPAFFHAIKMLKLYFFVGML